VASTQTSAAGAFSFLRTVTTNAQWYVKTGTVQSATVAQPVLAALVVRGAGVVSRAGVKLELSGTIRPSHAGERVALEQLRSGHWVTIARPKLNARSRFTVTTARRKLLAGAVERFRIVLAADASNARTTSGVFSISGG
jgi:hypothetical protein